jgi:hypothetical protein
MVDEAGVRAEQNEVAEEGGLARGGSQAAR